MENIFERSVNSILLLMFTSVLVLIAFSTCNCCSQSKDGNNSDKQGAEMSDTIINDSTK